MTRTAISRLIGTPAVLAASLPVPSGSSEHRTARVVEALDGLADRPVAAGHHHHGLAAPHRFGGKVGGMAGSFREHERRVEPGRAQSRVQPRPLPAQAPARRRRVHHQE
jgi:hypothetical protein